MVQVDFKSVTYPCVVYSGEDSLKQITKVVDRLGVTRCFVVCGESVAANSDLVERIANLLGSCYAGSFRKLRRNAPLDSVLAASEAALSAQADCLIAVGAGTLTMAARTVAIFMAEKGRPEELMTQYVADRPAHSPRLNAPKVPIFNVLTAPTNAQNRAGSAIQSPLVGHRMEYFDPKTRPAAIFWDPEALRTAPASLSVSAGLTVFWWALMAIGSVETAPLLAQADRRQAFDLALASLNRMGEPVDVEARIRMCAAAFLHNRDEDDGGRPFDSHWITRVCYALGSGIFTRDDRLDPGRVYVALTGSAIRHFGSRNLDILESMCRSLGWAGECAITPEQAEEVVGSFFSEAGHSCRLRDFGCARADFTQYRDFALRNFNADRDRQLLGEQDLLDAVLADAW